MQSILAALVRLCSVAAAAGELPKLTVYPATITLDNPRAEQRLIVSKKIPDTGGRVELLVKAKPAVAIEELYLATVSRVPS